MRKDLTLTITHKDNQSQVQFQNLENLSAADTFIVVGPGYYGYGVSIAAARKNCIKAGCPRSAKMRAYLGDESLGAGCFGVSANKVLVCLGEV